MIELTMLDILSNMRQGKKSRKSHCYKLGQMGVLSRAMDCIVGTETKQKKNIYFRIVTSI